MTIRIKNWSKLQHFKDRTPPWIKLYRDLLDDPDWHDLDGETAKILIGLWLIASEDEHKEGTLPDTRKLAFRLRLEISRIEKALTRLSHWLEQDDITMISTGYHADAPETETETKKEGETYSRGGKKRSSSGTKFPIPEEMKEALTLLCSHWPRKGHTRQGEIYDCRVWSDPQDLWDAMNKYFPDDDKKLMINCGLVYLEKINPVKGKPCEGARAMKNFYGPTEAYWKFEKEAVEERGNQ